MSHSICFESSSQFCKILVTYLKPFAIVLLSPLAWIGMKKDGFVNSFNTLYSILNNLLLSIFSKLPLSFTIGVCLVFSSLLSAGGEKELRFLHINTNNGLSNDIINCILQDNQGYIWIGTMEGLNRFDGYNNRVFKKELNNPASLADNMIFKIFMDHKSNIWIGTQYGLCRYNADYENFLRYILDSVRINVNTANRVTGIAENSKNELYIAVELGSLYHYRRSSHTFQKDTHDFKSIKDFIVDREDRFWIGGVEGLFCYDPQHDFVHQFALVDEHNRIFPISEVNTLLEEGDTIWAGTIKGRIYYVLKSTMTARLLDYNFEETYYIDDIFKDCAGLFYISTTNGLYLFDKLKRTSVAYKRQKDNSFALNGVGTTQTYEDIQGNIWVGAFQGGVNLAVSGKAFRNYNTFTQQITLDIVNINSMLQDCKGNLWLGSFDQGINVINPSTNRRKLFLNDPNNKHSLAYGSVYSIFEDSHHRIWIGNYLGYLQKYIPESDQFFSYPFDPELGSRSKGLDIRSIIEDKKGYLWIIAHGNGLSRFDPKSNTFKHFKSDYNHRDSTLADDWSFQIISDKEGIFWIATPSGLSRFDPESERFKNYFHDENDSFSLCNNYINTLYEDSNSKLWVGTKYGLDLFDRNTNRFVHFFEKDGLPSNQIKAILENMPGELWISTGNGLSRMRYTYETGSGIIHANFRNYNQSDNLQDIFFWDRSAIKLHNGLLVFGSEKGIIMFDPAEIIDNKRIPKVYFTNFKLFNQTVNIGDYDSLLTRNISNTDKIKLKYNQNFFTFEFVAINYISNENNQYKYRMEGFDPDWVNAGNKREATYTNLDPGKYTFRVKASNNDGYWNETGASLKLEISPPYWDTWLFRISIILLIVGLSIAVFLYRLRTLKVQNITLENRVQERTEELSTLNVQISEQNKLLEVQKSNIESAFEELTKYRTKLEELVDERTRELILAKEKAEESDRLKSSFLANLSHEIRTPLNSIIGFSGLMLDPDVTDDERISFKSIIEGSNNTLLNLINDIIDFSKIESGHLDIVITDVIISRIFADLKEIYDRNLSTYLSDKHGRVKFRMKLSTQVSEMVIRTDEIRIKQILSNLINNAFKFTSKGFVEIGCYPSKVAGMLEFYVKDTGIGIKKENIDIIFQRFRKVEEDNSNIYRGAGLGLAISQELVKILGGKIWVTSEDSKGSVFYFTVPLNPGTPYIKSQHILEMERKYPSLKNHVILIAEDDMANFSYIEKVLLKSNATILHAINGKQAISLAKSHPEISLILMDIKMPEMSGIEALQVLHKFDIRIPVIAQTAYAFSDEMRKILETGFTDYIVKPINPKELFEIILKYLPS
jgi:signal transduction histidine kinase/ligand-binding sensor domain-containing protein